MHERSPARAIRPPARAFFASDMHLHAGDPAGVEHAIRFVRHARSESADALFLLGDIFRAWLGPLSLRDRGLAPFLDELAATAAAGVRVVLVHGNHDYLLGAHAEQALGVEIAAQGLDVALGARRARLVHGDRFCTLDHGYQRLHRVLRAAPVRALSLALPDAAKRSVSEALLGSAGRCTMAKTSAEMGIVDDAVRAVFDSGIDVIVCGHVHAARDVCWDVHGRSVRLVVMADFERSGCHARFADGQLDLIEHDARFAGPPVVVAIDGPAGSGKSSVSRALAARLGFRYLDSGALYRAVTARALAAGAAPGSAALGELLSALVVEALPEGRVALDGTPVPDALLRSPEVSAQVSPMSSDPRVRAALLPVQRRAADGVPGLVAEGRDMGTVVFPGAEFRLYLDARPEVRAARRVAQSPAEGHALETALATMAVRDRRDSSRADAPLVRADGATVIDTSDMGLDQVVELLERLVRQPARGAGTQR